MIAQLTEGFSGADLQALVYNAHLEVVHSSIAADSKVTTTGEEEPIEYLVLGGGNGKSVTTRAEESSFQRRVILFIYLYHWMSNSILFPVATDSLKI
jgi:peroxin-1